MFWPQYLFHYAAFGNAAVNNLKLIVKNQVIFWFYPTRFDATKHLRSLQTLHGAMSMHLLFTFITFYTFRQGYWANMFVLLSSYNPKTVGGAVAS